VPQVKVNTARKTTLINTAEFSENNMKTPILRPLQLNYLQRPTLLSYFGLFHRTLFYWRLPYMRLFHKRNPMGCLVMGPAQMQGVYYTCRGRVADTGVELVLMIS